MVSLIELLAEQIFLKFYMPESYNARHLFATLLCNDLQDPFAERKSPFQLEHFGFRND